MTNLLTGVDLKISKRNKYLIFAIFYMYFIMAVFESYRGNFIPFFKEEFNTNNTTIGLIMIMSTVGTVIGSFIAGQMCEKFGHKLVFIIGTAISTSAIFITPIISNIYLLGTFYLIFGIGRSTLSISIDSLVPALSIGFEVILMNLTHFMYGLGSFIGQGLCGKLLVAGLTWRNIYTYLGIFFIASIIMSLLMKIPNIRVLHDADETKESDLSDFYNSPTMYYFVFTLAFMLVSESMISTWFINYIRSTYNFDPAKASNYASLFFLMYALGRLLGGFIINKLNDLRGLKIFLLFEAIFIFLGLILKESGIVLISFSGFFISVGFPTLMTIISKVYKQNSSSAIGYIVTFENIFFIILFYLVGVLNDLVGTYYAFFLSPFTLIVAIVGLTLIEKSTNLTRKHN